MSPSSSTDWDSTPPSTSDDGMSTSSASELQDEVSTLSSPTTQLQDDTVVAVEEVRTKLVGLRLDELSRPELRRLVVVLKVSSAW